MGTPTGKGKRCDVLALRDRVVSGATDLELAMDDQTCRASAQFMRFTTNLRAAQRAEVARIAQKEAMTGVVLREWQDSIVTSLDEYSPLKTELIWKPGQSWVEPSFFEEMGTFYTHCYP